jgi:hypothetical protein
MRDEGRAQPERLMKPLQFMIANDPARASFAALTPVILALALSWAAPQTPQKPPAAKPGAAAPAAPAGPSAAFPELGLTLTFPKLEEFDGRTKVDAQMWGQWRGKLSGVDVNIVLRVLPREEFHLNSPDDVLGLILNNKKDPERGGDPKYLFTKTETVAGPFGSLPWAEIGHGSVEPERNGDPPRQGLCLGAILPKNGYVVEAVASPPLEEKAAAPLVEFLKKGIVYKGPVVNPNWTDEEAHQRWQHDAPADAKEKLEPIIRTKHYIIFTNSAGGQAFAKKMEECYDAIKKTYPFDDSAFPRLLPVFLFRTPEQYYEYYSKLAGISREQAAKSKGHAWRDYYATWYESPGDPVHVHEATHQIFANRLRLGGGGSWFQEGVAEYMSTKPNDRNDAARQVKKEKHVKLEEFFVIPSLLYSAGADKRGGDGAGDHYKQAALLIEFLRDGPKLKAKFPEFMKSVGRAPRGDLPSLQKCVKDLYGVDVAGLDRLFVEYCQSR